METPINLPVEIPKTTETDRDIATKDLIVETLATDKDVATIEFVKPKTKLFTFTSTILGVNLNNHILLFDNCIFIDVDQNNSFSSLSVAMTQRNSTNIISSAVLTTDPDMRSESIAIALTKSLKTSIPIYVSFNADIKNIGLMDVTTSLINYFKSHPELINN